MIIYRFKVLFEDVDEVERVIDIRAGQTFLDFYRTIISSIGFDPETTGSFFSSGDNWRKGKEITNRDEEETLQMAATRLNAMVNDPHQKFLLITDDEMEWTLRVQLFNIYKSDDANGFPVLVKSVGEAPKQKKIVLIGKATNEFEEMVDGMVSEDEEVDTSQMGFDDGGDADDEDDMDVDMEEEDDDDMDSDDGDYDEDED
ncbi:MAG: hypothetical protein H6608_00570 [Flavobacteriales bacterium]|nr:hypothetical protein [Bacteroidota bacterium]MCB9239599.1 hypothetical protein [Flavobacteriales bacterium]